MALTGAQWAVLEPLVEVCRPHAKVPPRHLRPTLGDAIGWAVSFILASDQAHELPHAVALLDRLPGVPGWVVADRGYSSHALREHIRDLGAKPAIPAKNNEAWVSCSDRVYLHRNQVERLWARLKEWRAVATRYEKTARSTWECCYWQLPWIGSNANKS